MMPNPRDNFTPLDHVEESRHHRDSAQDRFERDIQKARAAGFPLSAIAKAAGYTSNSPVQHILRKRAQS